MIRENLTAYPELAEKREFITKVIRVEEESFAKTIDQGMKMLQNLAESRDVKVISGEDAFKLNDTFGFPIDLTREILEEKGIKVDVDRFHDLMKEQKKRSRAARKNAGADAWISDNTDLSDLAATAFVGYTELEAEAQVLAIVKDGKRIESAGEGESVLIVLDKTPFYAESGGQVGDTGDLTAEGFSADVDNTTKDISGNIFLHACDISEGSVSVGMTLRAAIDAERRNDIKRNHTAAHLLQAALREVLGSHVQQAGQLVSEDYLRFDFTHFEAMTAKELMDVEIMVNDKIFESIPVVTREMPIEEAKKLGATALFGEKYGETVRVVSAGDFSAEFCGGTHAENTSMLGVFKIRQEGSVAAGVRRIEALTGRGVLRYINNVQAVVVNAASALKLSNPKALVEGVQKAAEHMKAQQKEIESLNAKLASFNMKSIMARAEVYGDMTLVTGVTEGVGADVLRTMCENAIAGDPNLIAVIATVNKDGKINIAAACGKNAVDKGAHAGKLVKAAAQAAGGNGGGKPNLAMAGARDESKLEEALGIAKDAAKKMLG